MEMFQFWGTSKYNGFERIWINYHNSPTIISGFRSGREVKKNLWPSESTPSVFGLNGDGLAKTNRAPSDVWYDVVKSSREPSTISPEMGCLNYPPTGGLLLDLYINKVNTSIAEKAERSSNWEGSFEQ